MSICIWRAGLQKGERRRAQGAQGAERRGDGTQTFTAYDHFMSLRIYRSQ